MIAQAHHRRLVVIMPSVVPAILATLVRITLARRLIGARLLRAAMFGSAMLVSAMLGAGRRRRVAVARLSIVAAALAARLLPIRSGLLALGAGLLLRTVGAFGPFRTLGPLSARFLAFAGLATRLALGAAAATAAFAFTR